MKMNLLNSILIALMICGFLAFAPFRGIRQGIEGHLYKVSGNQMPSPDIKPAPPKGIKGTIYIYELTNVSQAVKKDGSFYSSVSTRLIRKIETNNKGYFKVYLSPGKYSLFIKKNKLLYSNRFDSQNNIAPVEVSPKQITKVDFRMDYNAVY